MESNSLSFCGQKSFGDIPRPGRFLSRLDAGSVRRNLGFTPSLPRLAACAPSHLLRPVPRPETMRKILAERWFPAKLPPHDTAGFIRH